MEINGKQYKVRGLIVEDIGAFSKLLDKLEFNLSDFIKDKNILQRAKGKVNKPQDHKERGEDLAEAAGIEIALEIANYLVRNYHKAQEEFNAFMGSLINVKPEAFKKMPINTPFIIFAELAKENELLDFFEKAAL